MRCYNEGMADDHDTPNPKKFWPPKSYADLRRRCIYWIAWLIVLYYAIGIIVTLIQGPDKLDPQSFIGW